MGRKPLLLDLAFIVAGIALSVLFVSADNAESPLSALIQMLFFVAITAVVSFAISRFTHNKLAAVFGSILIIDLFLALLLILPEIFSPYADPREHQEMLSVWPIIATVYTAPIVILCSIGVVNLAQRFYNKPVREQTSAQRRLALKTIPDVNSIPAA